MQAISLTIDAEWWGRAHLVPDTVPLHQGLDRDLAMLAELLDWLEEAQVKATFFCVAEDIPAPQLRRMASLGHEIASHSCSHPHLGQLGPDGWWPEISDSRKRLQDLSGQDIAGFRAPSWSVPWAHSSRFLEGLAEAGYRYDSSFCRFETHLYGDQRFARLPYRSEPGLWEIPLPQIGIPVAPWVGGTYLRLLPPWLSRRFIRQGKPAFLYLHPWELYVQPTPGLKGMNRLVTDYGRKRHFKHVKQLVASLQADFQFVTLAEQVNEWEAQQPNLS
jgi:peptidoglycan/xylan/chitin deacetylase (PgdA/CDA1 family)